MRLPVPSRSTVLLAASAGLMLLGGAYASLAGFGNASRQLIHRYFADHRMEVEIGRLSVDPFRGLVVRDVVVFEGRDRSARLARITHANIDLSLSSFLERQLVIDRIELNDTDLIFPRIRTASGEPPLRLRGLDATLHVRGDRLEITRAQGRTGNVRVRVKGSLDLPADRKPAQATPSERNPTALPASDGHTWQLLDRIAGELTQFAFDERPRSVLDLHAGGDLGRPGSLHLDFRLLARGFTWRSYPFRGGEVEGRFSREGLEIHRLLVHDDSGMIRGGFKLPDPGLRLEAQVESTLDFDRFLKAALGHSLLPETIRFHPSPRLHFSGSFDLDKPYSLEQLPLEISGSIEGDYLEAWGTLFQEYRADFHLAGQRFYFRNVDLRHRSGTAEGRILYAPEDGVRYSLQFRMDPAVLDPFPFPSGVKRFLRKWEFDEQSNVVLELAGEGPQRHPGTWRNSGSVNLSRCTFRGAPLRYLVAHFSFDRDRYVFTDFRTEFLPDERRGYPGGPVEGDSVVHSTATGVTDIRRVRGRLHPAQAVRCFSTTIAEHLDTYGFDNPPEISLQGALDTPQGRRTNLLIRFDAPGPAQLPLGKQPIALEDLEGELRIFDDTLTASGVRAALFGGAATGLLVIKDLFGSRTYDAELALAGADLSALTQRFLDIQSGSGKIDGRFGWSGTGIDLANLRGQGQISLSGCNLAETPLLSGLSTVLTRSVGDSPIARAEITEAAASCQLDGPSLSISDAFADFALCRLSGAGNINLSDLSIDSEWSLANREASGILLSVLYRLLGTYSCTGTLAKPVWRLEKPLPVPKDAGKPFTERLREEIGRSLKQRRQP